MSKTRCKIFLGKEAFKFSSAHMTLFADGTKEALHGHNYRVRTTLELKETAPSQLLPFSEYKKVIQSICNAWDEKVLLPEKSPFLKVLTDSTKEVEFILCQKRYVLPKEEILLLPIENVTSESLSELFCRQFLEIFQESHPNLPFCAIEVYVEETAGQGAIFSLAI